MIGLASASVAQVSECAFLVGSRGHSLGVISREVGKGSFYHLTMIDHCSIAVYILMTTASTVPAWMQQVLGSFCYK